MSAVQKFTRLLMVSRMYVVLQETVGYFLNFYVMAQFGVKKVNFSTSLKHQAGSKNTVYEIEPTIRTVSVKKVNMSKE